MTDLDLDAIEAEHYERMPQEPRRCMCGDLWPCTTLALVAEARRLRDLIHAKQSWIDGAKVDLDALDEQTLTLTASVAAHSTALEKEERKVAFLSRELHTKEHERDDARAAIARVRALHVDTIQPTVCNICEHDYRMPCGTLRALDGAS